MTLGVWRIFALASEQTGVPADDMKRRFNNAAEIRQQFSKKDGVVNTQPHLERRVAVNISAINLAILGN